MSCSPGAWARNRRFQSDDHGALIEFLIKSWLQLVEHFHPKAFGVILPLNSS
jgi:hypothetical protein